MTEPMIEPSLALAYLRSGIEQHPSLTSNGFVWLPDQPQCNDDYLNDFQRAADRLELLNLTAEGKEACVLGACWAASWISLQIRTKSYNRRHSSYGYKHMVEAWSRLQGSDVYVSNGVFIAVAAGMNFIPKVAFKSLNCIFQFSEKTATAYVGRCQNYKEYNNETARQRATMV